jgi:hypothetical protein
MIASVVITDRCHQHRPSSHERRAYEHDFVVAVNNIAHNGVVREEHPYFRDNFITFH